ncbi:MAG: formylglycine-generating enzyme family protein [Thiothrix sp.]|uniref:formylglycine-generating enzyme family protein n=1 Tax=Thiothrix sp. TaxID=1032 RepID=UPI002634F984|nr:formylglycine-generating enzyme family protein [Thiothrix sp.]MDD5394891.1 formylglycine-generating enzyme family protein [Thiothrix sp.]
MTSKASPLLLVLWLLLFPLLPFAQAASDGQPPSALPVVPIEPGMVTIPAGTFTMGCKPDRDNGVGNCSDDEKPAHETRISAFQLATADVTFAQWDACEAANACPHVDDVGWGRGNRPVLNVTWGDTHTYIQWLNRMTGKTYRLPTEAEWEYAARAGAATTYPWGNQASHEFANYGKGDCCGGEASGKDQWEYTSEVGSFAPNQFGLYDMLGNVSQWVEDCYVNSYKDAPNDGSARTCPSDAAAPHVFRGGSWDNGPWFLRAASRNYNTPEYLSSYVGFRLAKTNP